MKTFLVQEFEQPEDQEMFEIVTHALGWWSVANDVEHALRNSLKYGHDYKTADEALEAIRRLLYEVVDAQNISLD